MNDWIIHLIEDLTDDWRRFDQRIADVTREIEQLAKQDEHCKGLMGVPGIGPMTASAMVAAIGDGAAFSKGRDFAAWLDLVPKQISTGDRTILGGISRRGNRYLRTLFIQGARSVLQRSNGWEKKSFGRWLIAASKRLHKNVLAAALANKLARIAWAVLHKGCALRLSSDIATIGIVFVACCVARIASSVPAVVMTSTRALTSSAAYCEISSACSP